jgi:iron complex transport system substrate-binding protein
MRIRPSPLVDGLLMRRVLLGIAATTLLLIASGPRAEDTTPKPHRIVSLNLCADELVLRLADRENIASITWLSRDPDNSNVPELAAKVPINHGLAEEIIPLNPDLVVAGIHTTRTAVALLKRVRFPLIELEVPRSLNDVRAQIRQVAVAIGEGERGERVIADMDERLASTARPPPEKRLRALVLNPNGFTTGAGSLVDNIITTAGLTNLAAGIGLGNYARVPLENVVMSHPDVLILNGRRDGPPSLATELLQHPVLSALPHVRAIVLPSRLWVCGGPAIVDAIELLSRVATEVPVKGAAR